MIRYDYPELVESFNKYKHFTTPLSQAPAPIDYNRRVAFSFSVGELIIAGLFTGFLTVILGMAIVGG